MPDHLPRERPVLDPATTVFELGEWRVDPAGGTISKGGVLRRVQPRVMDLLCHLARNPDRTLTRQELLGAVWSDVHVVDDVVWRCVSLARIALEDDRDRPRYIQTVPRRGYRLVAPVRQAPVSPSRSTSPIESSSSPVSGTARRRTITALLLRGLPTARLGGVAAFAAVVAAAMLASAPGWPPAGGEGTTPSEAGEPLPSELRTAADYTRSGRAYYLRYQPEDLDRAAVQFQRALALQPEYAPALAGLADTYVLQSAWGRGPGLADRALENARRALELDPHLPEAYRSLGLAHLLRGHLEASLQASHRALELRPGWAPPMHNLAVAQAALGRLDLAVTTQRRLVAADSMPVYWGRLAWLFRELEMEESSIAAAEEALRREPFEAQATAALASLELDAGRPDRAWAELEPALALSERPVVLLKVAALTRMAMGDLPGARKYLLAWATSGAEPAADPGSLLLAALDIAEGRDADGHARLSRVREESLAAIGSGDERWEPHFQLAVWSAANGEANAAHRWLEQAIDRGFLDYRLLEPGSPYSVVGLPVVAGDLVSGVRGTLDAMRARVMPGLSDAPPDYS